MDNSKTPKSRKQTASTKDRRLRMLFTCVGRRVELLRAFRRAGEHLGITLDIHGADASKIAPGIHLVDKAHLTPRIGEDGAYIDSLIDIVRRAKIDLLIPLIDSELPLIAASADRFRDHGCEPLISSEQVITTCRDKLLTYKALKKAGIDTPATWDWTEAITRKTHKFPYFLKPKFGSASMGNYAIERLDELHTLGLRVPEPIVQELVKGIEHTLDVYTGFDGRPRCVVPRRRLEVRTGEVSKGVIVKDADIMAVGIQVAEMLDSCKGVITVQCIVTPKGRIRVIEINPRFGGGVPLSIHAGADFPRWILAHLLGESPRINPTAFRDDIAMLRFDDSVFVPNASKLIDKYGR